MSRAEQLRAEAEMAELEEKFVKDKESGKATREQRNELRAARESFRKLRDKVK